MHTNTDLRKSRTTPHMSALEISEQAALGSASTHSGKFKTTVYVNLAGTVERMDEQILPALYNFVGQSFSASPSQLGTLTLCRALVQALSSPISGLSGALACLTVVSQCVSNMYSPALVFG